MRKLFIISAVCLALGVAFAHAEDEGKYWLFATNGAFVNGDAGVNCALLAASTNVYRPFNVEDFDFVGLEVTVKAVSSGTSTVQIMGYKSAGVNYETAPSLYQLVTLNGTTAVTTFIPQSVVGASHLKVLIGNTNASLALTNVSILRRYKAPRVDDR